MEKFTVKELKNGKCFASYGLYEDEKIEKLKDEDIVVNVAYTDYGGDFFDKVCIEYFIEKYPDNVIWENTAYNGKNAVLHGDIVKEFLECTENYLLGFEDIEEFFCNMECTEYEDDFSYFLDDIENDYIIDKEFTLNWLMKNKQGEFSINTQGVDFSWDDLIAELVENNIMFKNDESLLYQFILNDIEVNIARYYVDQYNMGKIGELNISETILSIIKEYENSLV